MNTVTREMLLVRLFGSKPYMEKFADHFIKGLEIAVDAFSIFDQLAEKDQALAQKFEMELRQWRSRVIPNFIGMKENAIDAKINLKKGNTNTMRSATGNLRGLSKDMDGIGWEWWQEIDPSYWEQYVEHSNIAEQMAGNIYRTLSGYWRTGVILKETITGPINDQELMAHLKPGESL